MLVPVDLTTTSVTSSNSVVTGGLQPLPEGFIVYASALPDANAGTAKCRARIELLDPSGVIVGTLWGPAYLKSIALTPSRIAFPVQKNWTARIVVVTSAGYVSSSTPFKGKLYVETDRNLVVPGGPPYGEPIGFGRGDSRGQEVVAAASVWPAQTTSPYTWSRPMGVSAQYTTAAGGGRFLAFVVGDATRAYNVVSAADAFIPGSVGPYQLYGAPNTQASPANTTSATDVQMLNLRLPYEIFIPPNWTWQFLVINGVSAADTPSAALTATFEEWAGDG